MRGADDARAGEGCADDVRELGVRCADDEYELDVRLAVGVRWLSEARRCEAPCEEDVRVRGVGFRFSLMRP